MSQVRPGHRVPIWRRIRFASWAIAVTLLVAACGGESIDSPDTTAATAPAPSAPIPGDCGQPTALFPVAAVLNETPGTCREWVERSYGRAVNASTASATIWSRRTEDGTALVVGATHTLGLGWFGDPDTAVPESMVDPGDMTGVPRLFLIRPDGSGPDDLASPWFGLYNAAIVAERNNNLLHDLLPREDFYVAVTDSQKLDVSGLPPVVAPIVRAEVPLHDPAGATTADETWAEAVPGDLVLLLGYPNATGELTAGVGRVLTDTQAEQAVTRLAALGDVEGNIEYDADVEMIILGEAVAGMSGGAVVDRDGRLVGVLVRATDHHDGVQYVRAVRMSWVALRVAAVFGELSPADQLAVRGYLEITN
jgi:hypothetical protein